jgi:putative PEP-CTERM system TPR-repeat lipoprotein
MMDTKLNGIGKVSMALCRAKIEYLGVDVMMNCARVAVLFITAVVLTAGCNLSADPQRTIAKVQEFREKGNNKAAIIEIKNLLQKTPGHAEARYLLGATYYDSRYFRLAEQELRRALQLSYERSKVMPLLGRSMLMLGDYQKVLDEVPLEGHASTTVQADILTLRARALMGLGKVNQGRELLEAALVKQPEFPDAMLEQARLAFSEQKREEAFRLADRVIAVSPKHVEGWLMKGDLARLNGDQEGEIAANQKVLEIAPSNVMAHLNIATQHIANNKFDAARKLIAQARGLAPENVLSMHALAFLEFRVRDYKAANDAIQQVLKVMPDFMPSVLLGGAILTEMGSYEQAQGYLGRVVERAPGNLFARKLLVSSLARSGRTQRALEVLQPGLQQASEDGDLAMLAGELHLQNGEFGKAVDYFDKAAKRNPKDATTRTKLGISRMASGDTNRAYADLESAIELDTTQYQADMVLIVSHMKRGNYDFALKTMESLEKKQPNNPVTFDLKAKIFLERKDIPNARKNFERALELQPGFLSAATSLAQLDLQEKNSKSARRRLEAMIEKDKGNAQALLALADLGPALGATQKEQLAWLEQAIKIDSKSVQPRLMLVRLYGQMGDTRKALETAQQVHASSPDDLQLLDLLGTTLISARQNEQAVLTFRKVVQLQPKSPLALYRLARALVGNSESRAATEALRQALVLKPDFFEAYAALVDIEVRNGQFPAATNAARQAQKMVAKSPVGFALEGKVLTAEKRFLEAIKLYEAAHGIAKDGESLVALHTAYVLADKTAEGDARLAQWLKTFPDDPMVRLYAAENALMRGGYKEAIAHYEWLQQKQPDNLIVLNKLAWAYSQVKDPRALEIAEHAYKLEPTAISLITLHIAYASVGKAGEGDAKVAQWLKGAPNDASVRRYAGDTALKHGDNKAAIVHYEWLQQKQPGDALVLNNLAWAYYLEKDSRALEVAERAYKLSPENATVADTVGWLLLEKGDTVRGIALLEKALKAEPKNFSIRYRLAQGWNKVGDKSKARMALEQALATNESFPERDNAISLLKQLGK